jgi:hypothetical protein
MENEQSRAPGSVVQYETWQDEAWSFYDSLGEFRQGVRWLSGLLSRARLIAAYAPRHPGDEPTPIDPSLEDPATELVETIAHGIGGQSELLRQATVHLTVPGEGWFIGQAVGVEEAAWKFYSANEIRRKAVDGEVVVQVRLGEQKWKTLPNESLPIRVWRPHDRFHWKADSSTRAAIPIMRRLELLNRRVDAQTQSRLTSNGVYWVASEITFPENPAYPNSQDPFIDQFIDAGVTAIKTPGSAAAALPIINRAPAAYIKDGIRHDTFHDDDADLQAKREFEIRRLATALDVPPEVLLGMAGVNHWGAWQIEESTLKTTATTLLEFICWALTTGYMTPAIEALANDPITPQEELVGPDAPKRIVWYDISELAVRPDLSQNALTLNQGLVITDEATLRETGFNEADRLSGLDPAEMRIAVGRRLLGDPVYTPLALELLGVKTATITAPSPGISSAPEPAALPTGNGQGTPSSVSPAPGQGEPVSEPERSVVGGER